MSWVTVIWSMVSAACLTLAAMHLMAWCQRRTKWAQLLFAATAAGTAAMAAIELWLMVVETPAHYAAAARWYHVPAWVMVVSLAGFVRVYLGAGRRWLAWLVCILRTISLGLNFTVGQNLNFIEVTGLRRIAFFGESVALGEGVRNPAMLVGQLSLLLLIILVVDAAVTCWRRGDRRLALLVGGSIGFFALAATLQAVLVMWGLVEVPVCVSIPFLGVIATMAWEMSHGASRAAQLADILHESEARYRSIFERASQQSELILRTAAEGIIALDWQGKHTCVNPAAAGMLGYAPEELLGCDSHSVWHHAKAHGGPYPKDDCPICAAYRDGVAQHVASEVFWRKDGTCFPVEYRCTPVREDGRTVGAVVTFNDVTARQQAEAALRESQARLASGVELAGLGFYEIANGEHVTYVDDLMRATCGLPPETTHGVPARDFWLAHIHPDDLPRILDAHQRMNDGRLEKISAEYRYCHPDGRELWIQHLSIVTKRDNAGRAVLNIGVIRDITEQRRVTHELALQRMQLAHMARVSTIGQLASALAHELNQPLGAILRNAEAAELLLQEPSPDLDEVHAILADIRHDDQRAGGVIERMRVLIRRGEVEASQLDLNQVASDVIALLRHETEMRRARVALELAPALPPIHGDFVQLQQVVLNLLLNAIDAVRDSPPARRLVTVRSRPVGALVELAVCDCGHGIPPDDLARIFEPFVTSKSNGLGMGLPISRSIIEAHGGRLRAENNEGGGATFTFALPAVKASAE